jgi:hypothetical protein
MDKKALVVNEPAMTCDMEIAIFVCRYFAASKDGLRKSLKSQQEREKEGGYMRKSAGIVFRTAVIALLCAASCTQYSTFAVHAEDGAVIGYYRQLSDFPLYELRYEAPYNVVGPVTSVSPQAERAFACTCFSAIDASGNRVMGRNFDWKDDSVLVVITKPAGGYASVSVADMTYLVRLADAPAWPFDGMNERGLAAGLMAVDEAQSACEPGKPSVTAVGFIRVLLDSAATLDEAIALAGKYYVLFGGGPPIHYFIADQSGASAVIEYCKRELHVFRSERPWQVSTNFVLSKSPEDAWPRLCWRYALTSDRLSKTDGRLDAKGVFGLLEEVSQKNTLWSTSYDLTGTRLKLALGKNYAKTYSWNLTEIAGKNGKP